MRVAPEVMNMVRRKDENGGTAVVERGNPEDIAARVAAADAEARRAAVVADIEEFRSVVQRIADGSEPDGKALAAIGSLAQRLRLPPDAVARSVRAVQEERRLQADIERTKGRIKDVKSREVELAAEIKAAEKKLLTLREELAEYAGLHRGYPYQAQAVAAVRAEHPLLFGEVEHLAERVIKADAAMSTDTFKPATNYPHLEGASRGTWEN
jgi:hypothetical protein